MRIHALIFCWPGKVDNARHIAQQVREHVDRVTVIDASQSGGERSERFEWRDVDPGFYYGSKFREALNAFDGDVMLQIQADATHDDWPTLVAACRQAFAAQPALGIWSPDVWFTLFPTDRVALFQIDDSPLTVVAQSDCIVWALARPVIERMGRYDYSDNNLGWGIDWAAISYCFANKLLVTRDRSCRIAHPASRGYDSETAMKLMAGFIAQMTPDEQVQHILLQGFIATRNMGVKGHLESLRDATVRALKKRLA